MKLALTGKGGVGKTSIVALFARVLKESGNKVLLIDADPDMNLATVLGIPHEKEIIPIVELKDLIAERTGVERGMPAPFFKMNPKVDDIPDKYCVEWGGIKLIVIGAVKKGGSGCACPENAFLKNLLSYLVVNRDEWVILDMEAGIEHLGRGTAIGVDHMIAVVEPNKTSIETAYRIQKLSQDIGIKRVSIIGNKIQFQDEKEFLESELRDFQILGFIEYSDIIKKISLGIQSPMKIESILLESFKKIIDTLVRNPMQIR
ncbi:MAG: carbon monoxide dehydrogenase [Spirochaetes bacterium DG_61]|nr:MAG: carbon monoxide dehydrogenase [Spirochaetes bacterium DG_61]